MIRNIGIVALVVAAACHDTTAPQQAQLGEYTLTQFNGRQLPAASYDNALGHHEVVSATLTLRAFYDQQGTRQGFWTLSSVERITGSQVEVVQYSDSGYYWSAAPSEPIMTFVNRDVPEFSFAARIDGTSLRALVGGTGAISAPSHVVFTRR